MEESSDKATTLKKAYAEMILNTATESAARVMVSDRKSACFHHDLCGTKDEALRLLVRLKQMIDAKTIESEITSSNQQRQIDVLEAQLQEAEEIVTDLRSELRWVKDKLEKAKEQETINAHSEVVVVVGSLDSPKQDMSESLLNQSLVHHDECVGNDEKSVEISKGCDDVCESELDANIRDKLEKAKEQETISSHQEVVVVVASLNSPNQDISESLLNQSLLNGDECGGNDEKSVETSKGCDDVCEPELDANTRNKRLELSRNGCTQRIRALESKSSPCVNKEEQRAAVKRSGEILSSGNTRCLVLALRANNAEVITTEPSNALGIKKPSKSRGRRKRKWSKGKAKPVRPQSQLIKPCQSQSDLLCSKTSMDTSDGMETNLSVDAFNACKGLEEHLQRKNSTDNMVDACQESNLVSVNVEDGAKTKPLPRLNPESVKCEGEADSVMVPTNRKATAVVSNQISESRRTEGNRLVKYTFQRKRKRDL
ncbi:hypothetical protein V5N11_002523 [Cardamine amara subsp. amara]|uniref:Uncharacterized protein n=1 Tax=Cardamine amara subsp. amara TaxID=228776 RepID=A0ABD0ZUC1_CARAN